MTTEPKGRELDAWLAEHAEGFRWMRVDSGDGIIRRTLLPPEYARLCTLGTATGEERLAKVAFDEHVPHYSTDLTAAMQLAEQLTDRFHWRIHSPFQQGDKWFAGLTPLGVTGWNGRPDYEAGANTLPEALARVAYRALRGEEDV